MLARGRRVALNFADAVAQRRRDRALRDDDGAAVTEDAKATGGALAFGPRKVTR